MSRPSKVWFRRDTGWWMVTLDGKKIRLAEGRPNRKLAEQKFHELKAVQARPRPGLATCAARSLLIGRRYGTQLDAEPCHEPECGQSSPEIRGVVALSRRLASAVHAES
ncbi:MAG: hypothetical protein K8T91_14700 [Planctomycetes bacterium]|nr:hypothetical protein [Planctomycetota bacterium]